MKPFLYIVAFIFLWFTAPIWVPIVGIAGVAGASGVIISGHTSDFLGCVALIFVVVIIARASYRDGKAKSK